MTDLETVRTRAREYADAVRTLRSARGELRQAIAAADHARGGADRNELARAAEPYGRAKVFEAIGQRDLYSRAAAALEGYLTTTALTLRQGGGGRVLLDLSPDPVRSVPHPNYDFAYTVENVLREHELFLYISDVPSTSLAHRLAEGETAEVVG